MFRIAATHLKPSVRIPRRTFVSTVLLTRSWENESVSSLRREAKKQGSVSEHEARERPLPPPRAPVQQIRHSSTAETEVPGLPSSSEPPTLSPSFPKEFLDVKIPDTSVPIPEAPTPVPFVPDFWDSSRVKAESIPTEPISPSFIVVAGDTTLISASPTYSDFAEVKPTEESPATPKNQTFLQDVTEDLFFTSSIKLPRVRQPKAVAEDVPQLIIESSGSRHTDYSRTLDQDEVRGVWALLGLLASSWLVAGFLGPTPALADKAEQIPEQSVESTSEKH